MKLPRGTPLLDPPASASSDIAFILIIFFLVCASVQPDTGIGQDLPQAEERPAGPDRNIEVSITPTGIVIDGSPLPLAEFRRRIAEALAPRTRPADRVVVLRSAPGTPYDRWIRVTRAIDDAGGVLTLQLESRQTLEVD